MPERAIVFRLGFMFGATMPETAVNEKCEPHLSEYEVRFAEDFLIPPPAGDAIAPQ